MQHLQAQLDAERAASAKRDAEAARRESAATQRIADLEKERDNLRASHERDQPKSDAQPARDGKPRGKRSGNRGTGLRDLKDLPLEEGRVEIADPHLEQLVPEGKVVRHGFEDSYKLGHKRATKVLVVVSRVRYKAVDAEGNADVITTAMPSEMLPRAIVALSLAACSNSHRSSGNARGPASTLSGSRQSSGPSPPVTPLDPSASTVQQAAG